MIVVLFHCIAHILKVLELDQFRFKPLSSEWIWTSQSALEDLGTDWITKR